MLTLKISGWKAINVPNVCMYNISSAAVFFKGDFAQMADLRFLRILNAYTIPEVHAKFGFEKVHF